MSGYRPFRVASLTLLVVACDAGAPVGGGDPARLGIVGGAVDGAHDAVVALLRDSGNCSGTIIQVSGDQAVVLTAAHCVLPAPDEVVVGNDYAAADAVHLPVLEAQAHPAWNGADPNFDVGLVRVGGVPAGTPYLPVATAPDGLAAGTHVDHVGYGVTTALGAPASVRRSVQNTLGTLDEELLSYDQARGGPCDGDSGGPALAVDGTSRVVGVISAGAPGCDSLGIDVRVAPLVESFIAPFLGDAGGACDACVIAATSVGGACSAALDGCLNDAGCAALASCLAPCTDDSCRDACRESFAGGVALYDAIGTCVCEGSCASVCAGSEACPVPEDADTDVVQTGETDLADSDVGGDPDSADGSTGDVACGCALGAPSSGWVAWVGAAVTIGRRRRGARARTMASP